MLNNKILKTMMSIVLIIVYSFNSSSQECVDMPNPFEVFTNYGKWSFNITPVVYKKASITKDYGNTELVNKPMYSFQIGAKRNFFRTKKWGFNVGIFLGYIPSRNISFSLDKEDFAEIFGGFEEESGNQLSHRYLFIPLNVEYKKKIAKSMYFNVNAGINFNLIRDSTNEYNYRIITEEMGEIIEVREIFISYQNTLDQFIQFGGTLSAGFYFPFKNWMLQTNIIYNKNFQNLWEGEYQFGNLFVSEPTRGDYIVSGDYLGLSTTFYFKKRTKKKKEKRNQK